MKKTAYIRLTDVKPAVNKSIIRKITDMFTGEEDEPYTISGIYDERLIKTGILVEYYLKDKNDEDSIRRYHSHIEKISLSEECENVAFEDHRCAFDYPHEFFNGTDLILNYLINDLKERESFSENYFVGVIISHKTKQSHIEKIADDFRYLILYSEEKHLAEIYADHIMDYNSTAVIISDSLRSLYKYPVIISLSPSFYGKIKGYSGTFLTPYIPFIHQPEEVKFYAYTEKFSRMVLSAAFSEAREGR